MTFIEIRDVVVKKVKVGMEFASSKLRLLP
jgi:hypothetical protein